MSTPLKLQQRNKNNQHILHFSGDLTLEHIAGIKKAQILKLQNTSVILDISDIELFDTHGILLLIDIKNTLELEGCKVERLKLSEKFEQLYVVCEKNLPKNKLKKVRSWAIGDFFYNIGKMSMEAKDTLISFFSFFGGATQACLHALVNPKKLRFKSMLFHIEKSGVEALPIILITSFLIGVVVAFQGAVQLEKFGANIFIVEMVSISVTRELAPLLTAIVIAGRSASSYTAEIGVMKITEEIDAMKAMGFSVWQFLVVPRIFALFIVLPLLVFFADMVSIFGGMVVASSQLGISFEEFLMHMQDNVPIKHVIIGLLKAPLFGVLIAIIGSFRGFQVSSSTQSIGRLTTISVVNAIFWVIAMDALISVFLTELGL